MDQSVKRNFFILIVFLVLVIVGMVGYNFYKQVRSSGKTRPAVTVATSTPASFLSAEELARQEINLTEILTQKIAENGTTSTLVDLDKQTLTASFGTSSLKIVAGPFSTSTFTTYGQEVRKALSGLGAPRENDVINMLRVLDSQQAEELSSLKKSADIYDQITKALRAIKVPKTATSIHLSMLNEGNRIKILLGNMQKILDTPVLALESAIEYRKRLLSFSKSLVELNKLLRQSGVSFSESDNLKVFLNIK